MKIKLQRLLDRYLGGILIIFLSWFVFLKRRRKIRIKKIGIIKLWAVGESVLTLPMIKLLRKKFPKAEIEVLARKRNKEVYVGNGGVDKVRVLEETNLLRLFKKYDLVIDCEPYLNFSAILGFFTGKRSLGFDHGWRSRIYDFKIRYNDRQHMVWTYVDLLKIFNVGEKPDALIPLAYGKMNKLKVEKLLKEIKIRENDFLIGFCAGSAESGQGRKWPVERFADLADRLAEERGAKIILTGSSGEFSLNEEIRRMVKNKNQIINLAGLTSLKNYFYLVTRFKIFVSNDTGPMHIAAAQGVRTIGLFGPNLPLRFAPYGKGNGFLYKGAKCSPCINVHLGKIKNCLNPVCMKKITVNEVLEEIDRVFGK